MDRITIDDPKLRLACVRRRSARSLALRLAQREVRDPSVGREAERDLERSLRIPDEIRVEDVIAELPARHEVHAIGRDKFMQ